MTVLGIEMVPCTEKLRILLVPVRSANQFCTFQLIAAPCLLDVKVDNCLLAFTFHKKGIEIKTQTTFPLPLLEKTGKGARSMLCRFPLNWARKNIQNSELTWGLHGLKLKRPMCLLYNSYITTILRLQGEPPMSISISSAKCRGKSCWRWSSRLWNRNMFEICLQDEIRGIGARENICSWGT